MTIPGGFFRHASLLAAAITALALVGCGSAGRDAPPMPASELTAAAVLDIADRTRATGDLGIAISFYRRANAMAPKDPRPLIGLGEALNKIGSPNEAIDAYHEAMRLAPDNAAALRGCAVTLIALGQPEAAIDLFHKSIAIAPDARAYGGLGVAEDLAGDYQAADAAFHLALALAPHDLDLRNNYGLSQALMENYEAAVATMRAVATDTAAGPRHRLNFALVLGLAGRTDEARRVASIDLDERAVNSNLAYYAGLRKLPAKQRAAAILRPHAGEP